MISVHYTASIYCKDTLKWLKWLICQPPLTLIYVNIDFISSEWKLELTNIKVIFCTKLTLSFINSWWGTRSGIRHELHWVSKDYTHVKIIWVSARFSWKIMSWKLYFWDYHPFVNIFYNWQMFLKWVVILGFLNKIESFLFASKVPWYFW